MKPANLAMMPPRPTAMAQQILSSILRDGDFAIDATAGNGHDTAFLAECVGTSGRVLAFDVQEAAISAAREKVEAAGFGPRVKFFQQSHEMMDSHAAESSVAAVMFNLGYLPGDDHELTTETRSTLSALDAAARVLRPGGVLSVICYPGHAEGGAEAEAVESWMNARAGGGWRVTRYGAIGTRRPAPFLLLGVKAD